MGLLTRIASEKIKAIKDPSDLKTFFRWGRKNKVMYRHFGEYLAELMREKDFTSTSLATSVSTFYPISISTISAYINKTRNPSRENLIRIAFAMKINCVELNTLLKLAGFEELYPRDEADAIIIWCIDNRKGPEIAQELLDENNITRITIFDTKE